MIYDGTTRDHLEKNGLLATSIIVKKRDDVADIFLEDEKNNRKQIAEGIDFVDIEGITKDNKIYYITIIAEGEIYIADRVLYRESTEEEYRTVTMLIPIYWP